MAAVSPEAARALFAFAPLYARVVGTPEPAAPALAEVAVLPGKRVMPLELPMEHQVMKAMPPAELFQQGLAG